MSDVAAQKEAKRFHPIFHKDFDKLLECTGSSNKAVLLSFLYHCFKNTKLRHKDGTKYVTRSLEILGLSARISTSSVSSYMKEFESKGFITRQRKMFRQQGSCVTITQRFLSFINESRSNPSLVWVLSAANSGSSYVIETKGNKRNPLSNTSNTSSKTGNEKRNAWEGDFDDSICQITLAERVVIPEPTNEELERSHEAVVALYEQGNNAPPASQEKPVVKQKRKPVEKTVRSVLSATQKKYISSTVTNISQHVEITKPQQLTQEIEEAVLDPKRFSNSRNFIHRVNTIAKCIRQGHWRDPVVLDDVDSDDDVFRTVHVSRDSETGGTLIDVEQASTEDSEPMSAEDEKIWDAILGRTRNRQQAHAQL